MTIRGLRKFPELILNSAMLKEGTAVIVEHNRNHDFSHLPASGGIWYTGA